MYKFYNDCVDWPKNDVDGLSDMIDNAIDITRRTFLKYVDHSELADMAENLGYCWHPTQGLTMAADWHISYHRSKLHDKRVYYFRHSCIEYVFIRQIYVCVICKKPIEPYGYCKPCGQSVAIPINEIS
jgi:hypothetical protein